VRAAPFSYVALGTDMVSDWRRWFHDPRLLLILGLLLGIGLGLIVGWVVWPVTYYDTDISDLRVDYRDDFVVMVGALYAQEENADTARQLLSLLSDPNAPRSLDAIVVDVAERYIAGGASRTDIRYLVGLAQAFGSVTTPMQPFLNDGPP
jgi:hypothetical protein